MLADAGRISPRRPGGGPLSALRHRPGRQRVPEDPAPVQRPLERPIGTSSTHNKVWHGDAPYNPALVEKYLTIFRAVNNFVFAGDDGMTPALRLGFTREPLGFEDLLLPGQRVPRPRGGAEAREEGGCGIEDPAMLLACLVNSTKGTAGD